MWTDHLQSCVWAACFAEPVGDAVTAYNRALAGRWARTRAVDKRRSNAEFYGVADDAAALVNQMPSRPAFLAKPALPQSNYCNWSISPRDVYLQYKGADWAG